MRDQAYKVLGLKYLWNEALEGSDTEYLMDVEFELQDAAVELAEVVLRYDPLDGHTRLGEIFAYASKQGICVHQAIVELTNSALSQVQEV